MLSCRSIFKVFNSGAQMPGEDSGKATVAVGMSGGVDSAITAYLLKQQGFRVVGLTMQIWDGSISLPASSHSGCFGPGEVEDIKAAQEVAERVGVEHHVIPLAEEYKREVLAYFCREYKAGRTPNPCVRCNQAMKFGLMLEKARSVGVEFSYFATGHYARVARREDKRVVLLRAFDPEKDQSYFLSRLSSAQLFHLLLPLGELSKVRVKELARELGWSDLALKQESQDFIESDDYSVLFAPGDIKAGPIKDLQGNVLGMHRGLIYYTIGQRRGIGISGLAEPVYVVRLEPKENAVIIGPWGALLGSRFVVSNLNWIGLESAPASPLEIKAKIRQKHTASEAVVERLGDDSVVVQFSQPQTSITPGQAAVFYDEDVVLGSGTIERVLN